MRNYSRIFRNYMFLLKAHYIYVLISSIVLSALSAVTFANSLANDVLTIDYTIIPIVLYIFNMRIIKIQILQMNIINIIIAIIAAILFIVAIIHGFGSIVWMSILFKYNIVCPILIILIGYLYLCVLKIMSSDLGKPTGRKSENRIIVDVANKCHKRDYYLRVPKHIKQYIDAIKITMLYIAIAIILFCFSYGLQIFTEYDKYIIEDKGTEIVLMVFSGVVLLTITNIYSWLVFLILQRNIKPRAYRENKQGDTGTGDTGTDTKLNDK